ncbi:MAG TPA: TIGR03118 family protein [Telluria sp.]
MNNFYHRHARRLCMVALAATVSACAIVPHHGAYRQRNLVADSPAIPSEHKDPNLVNPWGIAFNPYGVVWVSDNRTGLSTLYDGNGVPQSLVVRVPGPSATVTGTPTGIVFYGGNAFTVSQAGVTGPSRFIFASEDGGIAGWAPNVNLTNAIRVVPTGPGNPLYTGLAIGAGGTGGLLYAADFRNGKVDVFNSTFARVTLPGTPFTDPYLPHGYAPFGLQQINGDIYVTYARHSATPGRAEAGHGLGFVSVFDPNGVFVRRLVSRGPLDAPWGLALAPASFGALANRLLVANHGDGTIHAFDLDSGDYRGQVRHPGGRPVRVDGLWGIAFGSGVANQPTNTLFFTAGPRGGAHGLYGRLDVATTVALAPAEGVAEPAAPQARLTVARDVGPATDR